MSDSRVCSRCGGRLLPEADRYGEYLTCLQCGFTVEGRTLANYKLKIEDLGRRHPFPRRAQHDPAY